MVTLTFNLSYAFTKYHAAIRDALRDRYLAENGFLPFYLLFAPIKVRHRIPVSSL